MSDPLAPERLAPPTPGQLRRLLGTERLRPRKSLSQNFLTDAAALDTIVDAAELQPDDRVVEHCQRSAAKHTFVTFRNIDCYENSKYVLSRL